MRQHLQKLKLKHHVTVLWNFQQVSITVTGELGLVKKIQKNTLAYSKEEAVELIRLLGFAMN